MRKKAVCQVVYIKSGNWCCKWTSTQLCIWVYQHLFAMSWCAFQQVWSVLHVKLENLEFLQKDFTQIPMVLN